MEVNPKQGDGGDSFGVREKVILKGQIDEAQKQRLDRTTDYCPVGQLFGKGIVSIEDQLEYQTTPANAASVEPAPVLQQISGLLAPGTIQARYLPETKVWGSGSDDRMLEHEGEVKLYFQCQSFTGVRRWVMLSGHTLSWNPIPMHLATGGLAGSTVATLRQAFAPTPLGPAELQVAVEMARGSGGRQNAQAAAVNGVVRKYQLVRKITLGGVLSGVPAALIHRALEKDPLSRYYREGNIPLEKEIIVSK